MDERMEKNTESYNELEQAAIRQNLTAAELAKIIVMEDYENAGYSGNDEWFDKVSDEAFIEAICKDFAHFKEYYPEYFEES